MANNKKKLILLSLFFFSFIILGNKNFNEAKKFLSLKKNEVNLRQGPSKDFPIRLIYKKKYLPVEILALWENWRKIFQEISIIVFKRQGYNDKALNSITKKTFSNYHIKYNHMLLTNFEILPSWCFLNNYEIKISSSDIRNQREKLRSLNHSN